MPDFIPENHEQFRAKFTLFTEWMEANGATFGFTPSEIDAITNARADHDAKLTDKQAQDLAALVAIAPRRKQCLNHRRPTIEMSSRMGAEHTLCSESEHDDVYPAFLAKGHNLHQQKVRREGTPMRLIWRG